MLSHFHRDHACPFLDLTICSNSRHHVCSLLHSYDYFNLTFCKKLIFKQKVVYTREQEDVTTIDIPNLLNAIKTDRRRRVAELLEQRVPLTPTFFFFFTIIIVGDRISETSIFCFYSVRSKYMKDASK